MFLLATEAGPRVLQLARKTVHQHRIAMLVDHVFDLADHPDQPLWREPALEYRELDTLTVLLANMRHAAQSSSSLSSVGFRDVVGYKDVHFKRSTQHERRVRRQIAPQMPRQ